MARKKKTVFGANEQATKNLVTSLDYSEPQTGYPITFGKGGFDHETLFTEIMGYDPTDSKVRFIWSAGNTVSGAIFAGNKLVSSKILDIQTSGDPATEVTVTYINDQGVVSSETFGIVDPDSMAELLDRVDKIEDWGKSAESDIIEKIENGAIAVTPSNNADGFSTYGLAVKVDDSADSDVSILDDKITVSKYYIKKVDDASTDYEYSAQYKLMVQKPGSDEFEQMGDTINIFKDFFLKGAHVCTFDKRLDTDTGQVLDWGDIDPTKIDTLGDVYAIITDEAYADASGWVEDPDTHEHIDVLLEKAPSGHNLYLKHTYLHLIVNTKLDDEKEPEEGNDTTTDVFLDFTEILGNGAFAELDAHVDEIEERLATVEGSYVTEIVIPDSTGSQFKTITVKTTKDGATEDTTFDIADSAYYDQVAENFEILNNDCSTFAACLTWQGLE